MDQPFKWSMQLLAAAGIVEWELNHNLKLHLHAKFQYIAGVQRSAWCNVSLIDLQQFSPR